MANSTVCQKPAKPRPDFPLFPHGNGLWAKKVRGKLCYFGKWSTDRRGEAALQRWADQKDDLLAGRQPRSKRGELVVAELVNRFLTHKESRVATGELKQRTWNAYYDTCQRVVEVFGRNRLVSDLVPEDFAKLRMSFARSHGPTTLETDVVRTRVLFKFGFEEHLIAAPVRYGQSFSTPSDKTLRIARASRGSKMFERDEVLAMLDAAPQPLRCMILLGLNAALGNHDVATLPLTALDLKAGWLTYARPKTGIDRKIPLWGETANELQYWLSIRPATKDPALRDLVFLISEDESWATKGTSSPVSKETASLLKRIGLNRYGRSFYSLRRTFRTIASAAKDETAANSLMGHAPRGDDMGSLYTQRIDDARLIAVTDFVRGWLFGVGKKS